MKATKDSTAEQAISKKETPGSEPEHPGVEQPIGSPSKQILFLQKTIGNQAVQRLLKSGSIQANLKISKPDDIYEQEADRVANRIMHLPEPEIRQKSNRPAGCTSCMDDEDETGQIQTWPLVGKITPLIKGQDTDAGKKADSSQSGLNDLTPLMARSGVGSPLNPRFKTEMEHTFGTDFSGVRLHSDPAAHEAAKAINAHAFTIGSDIYFARGASTADRGLLAHELTHVVQQVPYISRQTEAPGCDYSGLPEGMGYIHRDQPEIYVIFGTWRESDDFSSWGRQVVSDWIVWRFGSGVSASTRGHIIAVLMEGSHWQGSLPEAGCQYFFWHQRSLISEIVRMVRRMPEAEAAQAREAEAGLPGEAPQAGRAQGGEPSGGELEQLDQETTEPPSAEREPVEEQAPSRSGSEYEGGRGPMANRAAIPARISGPDFQPMGSIGTYTMKLDYSIAGADLLSQVVEAMNWVNYHWEIYDITPLARQGLSQEAAQQRRHQVVSEEAEVGTTEAAGRRFEHEAERLAEDVETLSTNTIADITTIQLMGASAIVSFGGVALGALADLMGGDFQEREIPMPRRDGVLLVRCIAQPSPQGSDGEIRRAASVSTKIVRVQHTAALAEAALELPGAQIAEKELQLELERRRDPLNQARIRQLEQELQDLQTSTSGSAVASIRVALRRKEREISSAIGVRKRQLERERDQLKEHLEFAEERESELREEAGGSSATIFRPSAALVSRETGQTYPLLLQLVELPRRGGTYAFKLSDVTTRDSRHYIGRGSTRDRAVWDAARELARHNEYGRGRIAFNMPENLPVNPQSMTLQSRPGPTAVVRQRLNDVAAALVLVGLFVPGVGQVAAVLGAALAAERLIDRWSQGTLRADAAAVSDLIGVFGAAAQGAAVIGKMRVVRTSNRFALVSSEANFTGLQRALNLQNTAEIATQVADWGGFVWGNLVTLDDILAISQKELRGEISHAEARRQRAQRMTSALRDSSIQIVGVARSRRRPGLEQTPPVEAEPTRRPTRHPPAEAEAESTRRPRQPPAEGEAESTRRTRRPRPEGEAEPTAEVDRPDLGRDLSGEERVGARATTPDGLHHIMILDDGRIIRCSISCAQIRQHYESFLSAQADSEPARALERELARLEGESLSTKNALDSNQEALGANPDAAAQERLQARKEQLEANREQIAKETARLDMDIRLFAADALSGELGVRTGRLISILEVLTPEQTREMHQRLGQRLFEHLAGRQAQTIRLFIRALELAGSNTVAKSEIIRILEHSRTQRRALRDPLLQELFSDLNELVETYSGHITSELYANFRRAIEENDFVQAREILTTARASLHRTVGTGRPQADAERIIEDARNGIVRAFAAYHGGSRHAMPEARVREILANPDAVYLSTGGGNRFIFRKGSDIVITEGPGQAAGNLVTAYGPSGQLGPSGVDAWSWRYPERTLEPDDPGFEITHEMIVNGQIPRGEGVFLPSADQVGP